MDGIPTTVNANSNANKIERRRQMIKEVIKNNPATFQFPFPRKESPKPGTSTADSKTTTVIKSSVPINHSDSESDEETVYNYLKMTPSGLLMRPTSPFAEYIRPHVLVRIAELLSEFSFDDYSTPYDFVKGKLPKVKSTLNQYDLDMTIKVFYLCLERNPFLVGLHRLFQDTKSGGRDEYWDVDGTHNFEVLATIIFFLASQLEPENLFEILTEHPWKGSKALYRFILKQRKKRKQGALMKLMKSIFPEDYVKGSMSQNLRATRHIIKKLVVSSPKQKTKLKLPTLNQSVTLPSSGRKDNKIAHTSTKKSGGSNGEIVRIHSVAKTMKLGESVAKLNVPLPSLDKNAFPKPPFPQGHPYDYPKMLREGLGLQAKKIEPRASYRAVAVPMKKVKEPKTSSRTVAIEMKELNEERILEWAAEIQAKKLNEQKITDQAVGIQEKKLSEPKMSDQAVGIQEKKLKEPKMSDQAVGGIRSKKLKEPKISEQAFGLPTKNVDETAFKSSEPVPSGSNILERAKTAAPVIKAPGNTESGSMSWKSSKSGIKTKREIYYKAGIDEIEFYSPLLIKKGPSIPDKPKTVHQESKAALVYGLPKKMDFQKKKMHTPKISVAGAYGGKPLGRENATWSKLGVLAAKLETILTNHKVAEKSGSTQTEGGLSSKGKKEARPFTAAVPREQKASGISYVEAGQVKMDYKSMEMGLAQIMQVKKLETRRGKKSGTESTNANI